MFGSLSKITVCIAGHGVEAALLKLPVSWDERTRLKCFYKNDEGLSEEVWIVVHPDHEPMRYNFEKGDWEILKIEDRD